MTITLAKPATTQAPRPQRRTRRLLRNLALAGITCFLCVFGWLQLGPVQLGGRASYVVTDGTSMLPHFRADGLVVTRAQDSYRVGEVVAYHNKQLNSVVMHRIVARDGDRYVFKGDNNGYRDQYHPTKSEIVGEEWLYWPGGGRLLLLLREPAVFAVIVGGLAFFAASGFVPQSSERRRDA